MDGVGVVCVCEGGRWAVLWANWFFLCWTSVGEGVFDLTRVCSA